MSKAKTATIAIVALLAISILSFFVPYDQIFSSIPYLRDLYNNTSLTINSKNGKAVVSINGKGYGETPVTIDDLNPGEYDIEITRVSDNTIFYEKKEVRITLEKGTESIIDLEIGPRGITSGYILYYTKSLQSGDNSGLLTLIGNPDDANVYLDGEYLSQAPIKAMKLNSKDYQIKLSKEGFEDITFPIIIRNKYNLNIQTTQFPIPTTLTK